MTWMNRKALVSVLALGGSVGIWSCTSTAPIESSTTGGAAGTGGSGTATGGSTASGGSQGCIPGFNCGGTPGTGGSTTAGSGGTGVVAGSGSSTGGTTGGTTTGSGGTDPTTGGTGATAGTGAGATAGTGGTDIPGSGGTGGTSGVSLGSIQVDAGALARDHSVVTFSLPTAAGKKNVVLKDSTGNQLPLQVDAQGKATFILPTLAAGAQATYTVEEVGADLPDGIGPTQGTDMQMHIKQGDTERFRWMLVPDNFANKPANDVRAGYIYPLYTPSGLQVAGDYGEDHPHMHGIWSAWTLTTYKNRKVDFWNGYDNSGHVDLEQVTGAWSGPVHAGLSATLKHEALTGVPPNMVMREKVMSETWVVTVYKTHEDAATPYYFFDIDSKQEVVTAEKLVIEEYHYGGFGYRSNIAWDAARGSVLTSEGLSRANGADGSRAKWCASYGPIEGRNGGFAGLSHPTNFRHPQGLRVHPTNPFWSFTPVTAAGGGRFEIVPGTPYVSKYRVVVFDGNADAALLNRLWDDFATPPTVTVLP